MRTVKRLLFSLAIPSVVLGMQAKAEAFSAKFSWAGIPACQRVSPAFTLRNVPPGTEQLRFVMHDEQVPSFHHGGSTAPYRGNDEIPRGAIRYIGPCPPRGERHEYRWTIDALDKTGRNLGTATAQAPFPP